MHQDIFVKDFKGAAFFARAKRDTRHQCIMSKGFCPIKMMVTMMVTSTTFVYIESTN
jgi:DMSO/TMAO reductase YedYZ heme-binding membrane subunit